MNKPIAEIYLKEEKEIYRAERFIEEVCDYYHVGNEYFANVMLGTTEAIRMVLKNSEGAGRFITVTAIKDNKGLTFNIKGGEPEGKTGEPTDILDQAIAKERLSRELFIIKSLSDQAQFEASGCAITLGFNISSLDAERSHSRIGQLTDYFERRKVKINKSDA